MLRVLSAVVLTVGLLGCAQGTSVGAAGGDDARAGVTALVQRWSDAGEAGDFDAVAATYADAPGFVWIEQGEARYTDRAAIVAGLEQARAMRLSIRNDVSDIVVTPLSPDAAAFRAGYTLAIAAEGFSVNSNGTLSGVAVKRDGVWRFLQGAFSERPVRREQHR